MANNKLNAVADEFVKWASAKNPMKSKPAPKSADANEPSEEDDVPSTGPNKKSNKASRVKKSFNKSLNMDDDG